MKNKIIILALLLSAITDAQASNLSYGGQNPAIFSGANPANSAALLSSVDRPKSTAMTANNTLSASSIVEQSVLSQASQKINDKIFNSAPGQSGTFDLGGGSTISYANVAGVVTLTVVDSHGITVIGGF